MRDNTKGVHAERWRHARGCGRFFNALRDTTTDHFLATYKTGEPQAEPGENRRAGPVSFRTAARGRVDRSRPLHFTFDGRAYRGFAGDTLASALLANGVHLVGRSFKYHRPRGIFAAGSEEPNALVTVIRDEAALHAQSAGHAGRALRGASSPRARTAGRASQRDVGRVNDWLSAFFPAGFYYKTFMWPRKAPGRRCTSPSSAAPPGWAVAPTQARSRPLCAALRALRRAGGGRRALRALPPRSRRRDAGARVMLCDESAEFGGSLLGDAARAHRRRCGARLGRAVRSRQLRRNARVTLLPRTTAFGYFPHNLIGLNERITDHLATPPRQLPRERLWQVRARHVVLATGAIERPLVFPGNDRPGIIARGRRADLSATATACCVGRRVVIVTACDAAYQAALDLHAAGVSVAAIADLRVRSAGRSAATRRAARASRSRRARRCSAPRAICASSAVILGEVDAAATRAAGHAHRLRFGADVGRLHAERAFVLAIARQARLGRGAQAFVPGRVGGARALGGRVPRHHRSRAGAGGRRERRRGGGRLVGRIRFASGRRGSPLQRRGVHRGAQARSWGRSPPQSPPASSNPSSTGSTM